MWQYGLKAPQRRRTIGVRHGGQVEVTTNTRQTYAQNEVPRLQLSRYYFQPLTLAGWHLRWKTWTPGVNEGTLLIAVPIHPPVEILRRLSLDTRHVSSPIPSEFERLKALRVLRLGCNDLTGEPRCHLRRLRVSSNNIQQSMRCSYACVHRYIAKPCRSAEGAPIESTFDITARSFV